MLFNLVVYGVLAYLGLLALIYFNQNRLVYFPARTMVSTPAALGWAYEEVWLETADGVQVHGWFVPPPHQPAPARGTVLLLHGNGGNISHRLDSVAFFGRMGLNSFLLDYRGYGQSAGQPDEAGTYQDAEAAWRWLVEERQLDPQRIIIIGRSLGGGVAVWLAQRHPPGALILDATFTSLPEVGAHHYPFLPVQLLSHNRYPNLERLPDIHVPLLITHSPTDRVVPFAHSQRLYAAANEPRTFLETRGNHTGPFSAEPYRTGLRTFIDDVLPAAAADPPSTVSPVLTAP